MILLELFDKPYPWRRGDPRDLGEEPTNAITGEGDPYRIFATVAEIIIATAKEHDPSSIGFSADEESRIKLYQRMSPILARKLNMDLTVEPVSGDDSMYFEFTKKVRS